MPLTLNPMQTTNAAGTFNIQSAGYVQGIALDDPALRNELAGGVVAATETNAMFGGIAVSEALAGVQGYVPNLGPSLSRATNIGAAGTPGAVTGFTVFNQAHHGLVTPQSPVPLYFPGMTMQFFRFGSGIRIPVAMDPVLTQNEGLIYNQPVSWDYGAQRLIPYVAAYAAAAVTSSTYTSNTGAFALTFAAPPGLAVGNDIFLTGFANNNFNGPFTVIGVAGNTVTVQAATGLGNINPGTGQLMAGGGALPIKGVVDHNIGNSLTVNFNPVSGQATYNYAGSVAVILL